MVYIRKNYDGQWYSFRLSKEEVVSVEELTIKFGLRTLQKINKLAADNGMKLSDTDKAALLNWAAMKFESFASDFIESRVEAEKKAKPAEPAGQAPAP